MAPFIDISLGLIIGLSLGLLGGGGSILTVPALVYIVGQTPQAAITASLVIVGANSMMGAFFHRAQGTVNWRTAFMFGGVGMITAYLAAGLSHLLPQNLLLMLFGLLMLVVGAYMLKRRTPQPRAEQENRIGVLLIAGAAVGVLTGFLGVGGGFLIVPALVMVVGLPMRQAVGTSLVVIAMNSVAGLLGHLAHPSPLNLSLLALFVAGGLAGTRAGATLAHRIQGQMLQRAFAVFVVLLAVGVLVDTMPRAI